VACRACGATCTLEQAQFALWTVRGLVALEGGQAWVCPACGESTNTEATARRLEYLTMTDFPNHEVVRRMEVPVYSLAAASGSVAGATNADEPAPVARGSNDTPKE